MYSKTGLKKVAKTMKDHLAYTTDDIRVRKRHLDKGGFVKGGDYKVKRTKEGTYKLKWYANSRKEKIRIYP